MEKLALQNMEEVESYYQGEKLFETKYGFFANDGKEYIIKTPLTPVPWINVLTNEDYGCVISQTGCGYSWWKNSVMCRLTRWVQDLVREEWGKFIYIRDNEEGSFWSLFYKPCLTKFDKFELRYGLGYVVYHTEYKGLETVVTIFVPPQEPLEIWKVKIKNKDSRTRDISLFSYFEWCLGNSDDIHREFQRTFIETSFDQELNSIFATKRKIPVPGFISTGLKEYPGDGFHSVNIPVSGYETDKVNFFGPYRTTVNPQAVEEGRLKNKVGKWIDPIASLKVDLNLEPLDEKEVVFLLGYNESYEKSKELIKRYSQIENVKQAFTQTIKFWNDLLGELKVQTPDKAFDILTNYWLKYQAIAGRLWARTAYYQYSGGYGFRDQLQDSLVFLPLKPELTKRQILLHAAHQFKDGVVYHWWHPLTELGARTNMTDDLLWMPYLTLFYLDETGDYSILDEKVPYVDGDKESLYQHCVKAIEVVLSRFSPRGLPLIGEGDWNDGMSAVGLNWKGESIWLGHFLYGILMRFSQVCEYKGEKERKERYLKRAEELKKAINEHGWDGEWYIRATRDDGKPLGSKICEEGKIFLNAQTWSVINETAPPERALKAMESVEKHLLKEYGPLLFYPAYKKPDPMIGYLSRYAPGVRENGGVYTHAACWAILAECKMKRGDMAYEMYSRICPVKRGMNPDLYFVEPYVTPGNSDGPDSENFGRGGWTWYTGSGAWLFHTSLNWILGIRAQEGGLLIDPCIPSAWRSFKVRRKFRGAVYNIEVENPEGVCSGIKEIYLDGNKLEGNLIPILNDGGEHTVKVLMGKQ
jgi:cellobiose phosphorylase